MLIKVSKTLLECALLYQAKNDVRYYLNGICFKADGRVVSTDGHRAFIGNSHKGELKEDVILSIQKPPTKRYDYAVIDTKSLIVNFYLDEDLKVGVCLCELIGGRFPDIDRIIPKERQACDAIGFNAKYLASIAPAAKLFNPKFEVITLELNGASSAAVAKLTNPYGEKGMVIIMPAKMW